MSWSLTDNHNVQHTNGAEIRLVSGTWQKPMEINPHIPEHIAAEEQLQLIRQALRFARLQTNTQRESA